MKFRDPLPLDVVMPYLSPEDRVEVLRWLWARYQHCGFPIGSFPKRFARNAFESLSADKGHPRAASLCYQYRRQVLRPRAGNWTVSEFFTHAVEEWQAERSAR